MNTPPLDEQAEELQQHLLDEELRSMVRATRDSGMPLEDCQKSLARALYKELPPGSPKGPVVRKAKELIKEVYDEARDDG